MVARRCAIRRMLTIRIHAVALAVEASKRLARRRLRPSHAKVRSTTQRRGRTTKPVVWSDRLTIWKVQRPSLAMAAFSFGPA